MLVRRIIRVRGVLRVTRGPYNCGVLDGAFRRPPGVRRVLQSLVCAALLVPAADSIPSLRWNLHVWQRLRGANRDAPQTATDQYFRSMAAWLPARGEIGLVQAPPATSEDAVRTHYLLQYALAPRLIVKTHDRDVVLVYGPRTVLPDEARFELVRSFGDELRLYRRVTR